MILILIIILVSSFSSASYAQLSPGDLHKSHAHLEGIENCTQCHARGKKLDPGLCLKCHQILKERIKAENGLHANADYKSCESCHVEHQGRNFDLIYWKNGQRNFDHSQTGYTLTGRHANLDCQECHISGNLTDIKSIRDAKKNPDKTFLGLSQNCTTCHIDEHRGQLAEKCETCHSTDVWKPVSTFDHNKSAFTLTGKHLQVDCQKCHPLLNDKPIKNDNNYAKLKGIDHRYCQDCHTDIHSNRFGTNCLKCHSTAGWHGKAGKDFKHDITNYPLRGKHRYVQCHACHKPGKPLKIKRYSACRDCHSDYHNGQFAHREQNGACEECHSVEGFSPSSFTIGQHKKTKYPLQGAHLAIPCIACHKKSNRKINFSFQSGRCQSCHIDPHKSEVDTYLTKISLVTNSAGCEHCHQESSWSNIEFDHGLTDFSLEGRHYQIKCGQCHNKAPNNIIRIKNLASDCHSCHKDIHYGQFKDASGSELVNCQKCHTPQDWKASQFDHNTQSRFPLQGRHSSVECVKCHTQTNKNNVIFTLYRPLSTECKSCHGSVGPPAIKN